MLRPLRSGEELWNLNWAAKQALVDGPIVDVARLGFLFVSSSLPPVACRSDCKVQTNAAFRDAEGVAFRCWGPVPRCSSEWALEFAQAILLRELQTLSPLQVPQSQPVHEEPDPLHTNSSNKSIARPSRDI